MHKLIAIMAETISNDVELSHITLNQIAEQCAQEAIEFAMGYNSWHEKLSAADKCTVHPPAGSGAGIGIYPKLDLALIDDYIKTL